MRRARATATARTVYNLRLARAPSRPHSSSRSAVSSSTGLRRVEALERVGRGLGRFGRELPDALEAVAEDRRGGCAGAGRLGTNLLEDVRLGRG